MALSGLDIINSLKELKDPASITCIVKHLQDKNKASRTNLLEEAKVLLEAGVRFGCIIEEENKFSWLENFKENEVDQDINKETAMSNNEKSSSSDRTEKLDDERKTTEDVGGQLISGEDDNNPEDDCDDAVDCYGPSYRRKRNRSRSRRRSKSGKRLSSRRRRKHR